MRTLLAVLVLPALLVACGTNGSAPSDVADTVDAAADTTSDAPPACPAGDPCDDDNACTDDDRCQADGSCAGTAVEIDDGLDCTEDACDAKAGPTHGLRAGFCRIEGKCYGDGDAKLGDACRLCRALDAPETWSGDQGASCDDGDPCTTDDACEASGACRGAARDCDDGNGCTFDECRPAVGCAHDPVNLGCDDGDACTVEDRCDEGQCKPGASADCDDGDPCTADGCDSASGCVHGPDLAACDDGNDCTTDACTPAGCEHVALTSGPCSDGDACTLGDACNNGVCVAGTGAPDCDDDNPCTADSCLPSAGCVNAFTSDPCDDGVDCTDTDTCVYGVCVGTDTFDACPACDYYQPTGPVQKSLVIQMGSDGKSGSGLDVDENPDTCAPAGKCNNGVDNALALLSLFINPLFTDGLAAGELVFIVEYQDLAFDGTPFTLNTFFGLPHPYINPDCPASDDCTYVIPSYNFTPDCRPLVSLDNAAIVENHITAGGKQYVFPMVLPFDTGIAVQLTLLWARFEGDVAVDSVTGEILTMEGLVGGAVPKTALIDTINAIPDNYFTIDKSQVLNLLEATVDQDVDLDGDGAMDALSIGFRFSTVPTTVTTLH